MSSFVICEAFRLYGACWSDIWIPGIVSDVHAFSERRGAVPPGGLVGFHPDSATYWPPDPSRVSLSVRWHQLSPTLKDCCVVRFKWTHQYEACTAVPGPWWDTARQQALWLVPTCTVPLPFPFHPGSGIFCPTNESLYVSVSVSLGETVAAAWKK